MAERIGDERGGAVAPDPDEAVGRAEVDADDHGLPHPYALSTWRAMTIFMTSLAPSVIR